MTDEDRILVVVEVYYAGLMHCRSYPMPIPAAKDFMDKLESAAEESLQEK